jgi:hypothetical protein
MEGANCASRLANATSSRKGLTTREITMAWELTGNPNTVPPANFVGTTDGQPLVLKTVGTEALLIDTLQNVGIGTANPKVRTQLEGAVDPEATLAITRSDNPKFMRLGVGTVGVALDFDPTSPFVIQNNVSDDVGAHFVGQELLRVMPQGQVGIGTSNPTSQLSVSGAPSTSLVTVKDNVSGGSLNLGSQGTGETYITWVQAGRSMDRMPISILIQQVVLWYSNRGARK